MSDKSRFEFNDAGIRELMQSAPMQEVVGQYAQKVAGSAGAGYAYSVHLSDQRCIANVYPDDEEAAQDNYENNTLLKALGG